MKAHPDTINDYDQLDVIATFSNSDVTAWLLPNPDGDGYLVTWTDHVANNWTECYRDLPVAVLRYGLLLHGVESGRWFTDGPPTFAVYADGFLAQHTGE